MTKSDKDSALFAKMKRRRAAVLSSIKEAYPEMRDQAALVRRLGLVQHGTFRIPFNAVGYKDPKQFPGLDYVAWRVEDRLRSYFTKLPRNPAICEDLPAYLFTRPDPAQGPSSAGYRQYQLQRLADESPGNSPRSVASIQATVLLRLLLYYCPPGHTYRYL
jgi:hypothetical protein